MAVTALSFIVLGGLVYIGSIAWDSIQRSRSAQTMVREWAHKLGEEQKTAPDLTHPADITLSQIDPWGNSLVATYHNGAIKSVTVRSAGRDGKYNTSDDYVARVTSIDGKEVKAKMLRGVEKISEHIGRGLVRGGIKGLKDEVDGDK